MNLDITILLISIRYLLSKMFSIFIDNRIEFRVLVVYDQLASGYPGSNIYLPRLPGNFTLHCVNIFNLCNFVARIIGFIWSYTADGGLAGCCDH